MYICLLSGTQTADPVTYDDDGNVIPLSQRFNVENEDIRYSRKNIDNQGKKVYNKRKKSYTNEFATNAMIWSRSAGTMVGEQNIFYRNGNWVLVEKTEDYFVELGTYSDIQRAEVLREVKNTMKPYEKTFIHMLCAMKVNEDTICGIMAMLNGNDIAMDEVVSFIKANPQATEAQIIKATSKEIGVK